MNRAPAPSFNAASALHVFSPGGAVSSSWLWPPIRRRGERPRAAKMLAKAAAVAGS